jgi:HNH endonuclease
MKIIRIGDVQNSLVRFILWQIDREPTDRHLQPAKDYFDNKCVYCGEGEGLDFDHAVPINKKSLGQGRVGNLVPSCGDCNQKKGQKDFREYLKGDPDGDKKIAKILAYMASKNYVPLGDNKQVKLLIEAARAEIAGVAEKYIAAIRNLLTDSPTALPPPPSGPPAFPTLPSVVSMASNGVNRSTGTNPKLAKIYEIKRRMNRSWINLRRGCLDQMGVSVPHGTPKVGASSRAFAKKAHEATRLKYPEIIALLDQHALGLES